MHSLTGVAFDGVRHKKPVSFKNVESLLHEIERFVAVLDKQLDVSIPDFFRILHSGKFFGFDIRQILQCSGMKRG
ncbi:hypothetical protein [Legionella erythra]|uniref:hypothetical protein n=1 Tax=Legionella erythra TaxID=448 RepID=UPI0007304A63|nr:hypothetical protein [Legionella erythra]